VSKSAKVVLAKSIITDRDWRIHGPKNGDENHDIYPFGHASAAPQNASAIKMAMNAMMLSIGIT
jgi:hypothetical protein